MVQCAGNRITVWYGPAGGTLTRAVSVSTATVVTTSSFWLGGSGTGIYRYDDVELNALTPTSAAYAYDPLGRRLSKAVTTGATTVTTKYAYDGWNVIEERNGADAVQATWVHAVAMDTPLQMRRGSTDSYYHQDDQGRILALTNAAGAVTERYVYGDFGMPAVFTAGGVELSGTAQGNPFLYANN